ncbi:hypothetical protein [Acidicapsa acidisoli]|uniref:hypothetical protein n=1 Tax=Acidicapsa acidisoli TaxID=1615681 RepID=UPI0021E091DD|nr:hypothetical protein [Acidicapsa acidisoli]
MRKLRNTQDITLSAQSPNHNLRDTQLSDDASNEELMHLQADGFWGCEKGFHDGEEHWRQQQN